MDYLRSGAANESPEERDQRLGWLAEDAQRKVSLSNRLVVVAAGSLGWSTTWAVMVHSSGPWLTFFLFMMTVSISFMVVGVKRGNDGRTERRRYKRIRERDALRAYLASVKEVE